MILSSDVESIFSDPDRILEIELTYQNGGKVIGTIRKVKYKPLRIVLQKSHSIKGENPRHRVVLDHVIHLRIRLEDGSEVYFP